MSEHSESAKILILEDNGEWISIIRKHLSAASYQFSDASSVEQARLLLQRQSYDLIILDLKLSDTSEHLYTDLGRLIFAIEHDHLHGDLRPQIIVVTNYPIDDKVLNDHGGWIWGWHEKPQIGDGESLRRNVVKALETRKSLLQGIGNFSINNHGTLKLDITQLTIMQLLGLLKPKDLWTVGGAFVLLLSGISYYAYQLGSLVHKP